jgi:hypothetical protein
MQYIEDRFDPPDAHGSDRVEPIVSNWNPRDAEDDNDADPFDDLDERDDRSERHYECTDTTPIDYSRGPHDRELDIDDNDEIDG